MEYFFFYYDIFAWQAARFHSPILITIMRPDVLLSVILIILNKDSHYILHYTVTESSSPDKMICIIKNDKYFVIATDMFLAGFMRFNFQNDKSSNFIKHGKWYLNALAIFHSTQQKSKQEKSSLSLMLIILLYIFIIYTEKGKQDQTQLWNSTGVSKQREIEKERV